jgi:hypothetical protein
LIVALTVAVTVAPDGSEPTRGMTTTLSVAAAESTVFAKPFQMQSKISDSEGSNGAEAGLNREYWFCRS